MKLEIDVTFNEEQKKEIIEKCMEMLNTTDCTTLNVHILWTEEQKEKLMSFWKERFIKELEKMKEELFFYDSPIYEKEKIEALFDKHITELKGKNNE